MLIFLFFSFNTFFIKFYGLFKQATIGDCNIEKPGLFDFVARAKYDAWNSFHGIGFRDARNLYIAAVEALKVGWSRQGEYEYIPSPEEIKVCFFFEF